MGSEASPESADTFLCDFKAKVEQAEKDGCRESTVLYLEEEFCDALSDASINLVEQQTELEMSLKGILLQSRTQHSLSNDHKISLLLYNADQYVKVGRQKMKDIQQMTWKKYTQAAMYADIILGTSLVAFTKQVIASPKEESAMILVLSDTFEQARILQQGEDLKSKKWIAPSSFERSTTKYWVKNPQLNQVLLAAVAEAPLLVYGKSGHLLSNDDCRQPFAKADGDPLWDIHSAYHISIL